MKTLLTISVAILLLLSSCNSQKKVMDSWMGSNQHALIMSWGPPDRTADDGAGGQILIYGRHVYAPSLGWNFWEYKMMYAHADGTIYHWVMKREQVPPQQIDVRFLN